VSGRGERPTIGPRGPWLFRLLLSLLPPGFRRRFGREMEADLRRRLDEASSRSERLRLRAGSVWDLLRHAGPEWVAELRDRRSASPAPSRVGLLRRLGQDARYAFRSLRTAPAFAGAAVLTVGLGIGANTAVFTVVDAVLLEPLPYAQPDRLVTVWPETNFNIAMVERVEREVDALEGVSGISVWEFTLVGDGDPMRLSGALVSPDHFELLGVEPELGRTFRPEDALPDRAGVVILSHGLWVRRYGADPGVVGRTIELAGHDFESRTVIGVMPESHRPVVGERVQLWAPLHVEPGISVAEDRSMHVNWRIGRLAPGATPERAAAQLAPVARGIRSDMPENIDEEQVRTASVELFHGHQVDDVDTALWILLGAVSLVLLIACANVANLLMARGEGREQELAVRRVMGAGPGRLARQLLMESALMGVAGGALGVLLAARGVPTLMTLAPENFPRAGEVTVDGPVLLFALAVSLLSALFFGVVPALRAAGRDPAPTLRAGGGRGAAAGRLDRGLSRWLVGAEVALAVVLVSGAALMARSLGSLYDVDPGFRAEGLLAFRLSPPESRYHEGVEFVRYYERVLERIEAVPGVEAASGIHLLPLTGGNWSFPLYPEGVTVPEGDPAPLANFRVVQPDYFRVAGVPVVRGRASPEALSGSEARSAVVNRAFVERYWPGEEAVGREVRLFNPGGQAFRVVGVVGDVRQHALDIEPRPELYVPHPQWTGAVGMWILTRTPGDPGALAGPVRQAVWEVDAEVPISQMNAMERVVARSAGTRRFLAVLLASFGGLALILGSVGVYGVTSYTVARRVPEFGVRVALGASRAAVLRRALAGGMAPVAVGLVVGVGAALWATGFLEGLLFGVRARDPGTLAAVAAVLTVVAVVATWAPAWRASGVDPVRALREGS